MNMANWPGKMWPVSHKTAAIAAGMGQMGHHRILIHPRFGNFIVLDTILIDQEVNAYDQPINFNPCIEFKLCASVCPVGAVAVDGHFCFSNCFTYNYRDRMGGFSDWVEKVVASKFDWSIYYTHLTV
jgi:epoxyqueuosine reductase QueG